MESEEKLNVVCHYCHNTISVKCNNLSDDKTVNKCREWLDNCNLKDDSSVYEESLSSEAATSQENDLVEDNNVVAVALKSENVHLQDEMIIANNHNNEIIEIDNLMNKKCSRYSLRKHSNKQIQKRPHWRCNAHKRTSVRESTKANNHSKYCDKSKSDTPKKIQILHCSTNTMAGTTSTRPQRRHTPEGTSQIPHSASEEAYTQAGNNLLVRYIQQMHVESKHWNDIAYNFLIGAEGSIYEGRGWGLVGAHAFSYNKISIGICFIGCYINKLPPEAVMKKAKEFIEYGVEIGAIDEDYRILAHCQCSSTESPGRRFFEEIKTWEKWDGSISLENPSPLIPTQTS